MTSTDRDPVSTGEYGEIGAVGDDGVVLVGIGKKVFEITPPNGGVPVAKRISLEGVPIARVAGRTFVQRYEPQRELSWSNPGGQVVTIPGADSRAITESGEFYNPTDGYLTKWSPNGEVLFKKTLKQSMYSHHVVLGPEGVVFVTARGRDGRDKVYAFSPAGELLWNTDLGNNVFSYLPTTSGGIWARYLTGQDAEVWTHLTGDGFPDAVTRLPYGFALSPSEEPVSIGLRGYTTVLSCGLADGGSAQSFPSGSPLQASTIMHRLSSIGSILWVKQVAPPFRNPSSSMLGTGVGYYTAWLQKAENLFECHLTAVDLGAPPMDSPWPFSNGMWPDGSRRARQRSHSAPVVTMIGKPRHSGAVIEFGVEDNQEYRVETADRADGPWRSVGTVTGSGFGTRFTDPTSVADPMRFYRVRRSP